MARSTEALGRICVPATEQAGRTAQQQESGGLSAVEKALAILNCFDAARRVMGVSEIARRSGIPKSSVFRLLQALVDGGVVTKVGTTYSPGLKVAELAAVTVLPPIGHQLRDVGLPHVLDLYETTRETVHLAVADGKRLICIDSIGGHHTQGRSLRVGATIPITTSALGKAVLPHRVDHPIPPGLASEFRAIRADLVAYDRGLTVPGLACVAAPLIDWGGDVVGAVSVCGRAGRFQPTRAAAAVRNAAAGIVASIQTTSARLS